MTGLLGISVAGCAPTVGSRTASVACDSFGPISYSRTKDTKDTVRQIVGHNATGKAICGWKAR